MDESWAIEGLNYWENPKCPKEYLVNAMVGLLEFVEGEVVPHDEIEKNGH